MWDFSSASRSALMGKTMPFILFRLVVYVGIAIAYVLATGVGAGVGFGVGSFWGADGQIERVALGRDLRLRPHRGGALLPPRIHPLRRQGRAHRGPGRADRWP